MKVSMNKRCPRCNAKAPAVARICPNCQLNYEKFDSATNREAKDAMRADESDRVLMRKGCPPDVKRWKLLLMAIFLGFMGGHYYYVGRNKMGLFFTSFFMVGVINGLLTTFLADYLTGVWYQLFTILVLIWGIVIMFWMVDVIKIIFNHFKIPVSRS
ncbi:MAG: hypothetical protein IKC49_03260 [Clostridia bacterium]|nr:hypothetical protein [Clostridia bacterium]